MRILVAGRHGQLARSLAERGTGHTLAFAGRAEIDLTDAAALAELMARERPDLIVNAAAYTAVDLAESEVDEAMRINAVLPGRLARAAADAGARLIHISTDYVFDGTSAGAYREDAPVAPLGSYGRSKRAGEEAVLAAGGDVVIFRTAWVYGPFGSNFVKTMLQLAETRDTINVVADQRGSPTSSLDLADAILAFAERWRGSNADPIYHVVGEGETSWAAFARAIFAASASLGGPSAKVRDIPSSAYLTPARRPANSVLDSSAFAGFIGRTVPGWRQSLPDVVRCVIGAA